MLIRGLTTSIKPDLEVSASAEDTPVTRNDNDLDAVVDIEHAVRLLELQHHGSREGIVVLGAVQREDDDRGVLFVVLGFYLGPGAVVVGCRELDGGAGVHHLDYLLLDAFRNSYFKRQEGC